MTELSWDILSLFIDQDRVTGNHPNKWGAGDLDIHTLCNIFTSGKSAILTALNDLIVRGLVEKVPAQECYQLKVVGSNDDAR